MIEMFKSSNEHEFTKGLNKLVESGKELLGSPVSHNGYFYIWFKEKKRTGKNK